MTRPNDSARLDVQERDINSIHPYETNPRQNDQAVDAVAESIHEFGFRQPIVVDTAGVIICGHTRHKAALKLGLKKVPVHVATDLSEAQIKAYRIADNKSAEMAEWDMDLLPLELMGLAEMDVDITTLGFTAEELARLMAGDNEDGLTDPDDVPEPPDEATTQPGDIWELGEHRLMCGDSALAEDVDLLLDGAKIHLVNTDPPYNVKVEPRSNNAIAAGNSSFAASTKSGKTGHHQKFDLKRHPEKAKPTQKKMRAKDRPLANDFVSDAVFDQLLIDWFGNIARVLAPGRAFYIWGGYANLGNYPGPMKQAGLYFSQAVVWDKMHPVLTRKDFMGAFEICFYGWKEGAAHKWHGPTNATDLWHLKKVTPQRMVHLTEKPVELAVRAMEYSSLPGEHVLDLFGGSGSTLIAAQQSRRRAFLMELDALYCDVIVSRFEAFTGKNAKRKNAKRRTAARVAKTA